MLSLEVDRVKHDGKLRGSHAKLHMPLRPLQTSPRHPLHTFRCQMQLNNEAESLPSQTSFEVVSVAVAVSVSVSVADWCWRLHGTRKLLI